MGIFGRLFGKKDEKNATTQISESVENITIYAQSEIPESCLIGNLIFEKKYKEAIELGNNLLKNTSENSGIHVNLMDAYFKSRDVNSEYFSLSTFHAKRAMIYGHNTGYVQKRLIINLEKERYFYQAIQLCDIILSDNFNFSSHGCGNSDDYYSRKAKLLLKLPNSVDTKNDKLFTDDELTIIYNNIQLSNEQENKIRLEAEKANKKYEEWFSEESSNKRVERLKNVLYGNENQNS